MKEMRTFRDFIFTVNFRHTFAILLLVCFMILCYFKSKGKPSLDAEIAIVGTLLTLAGKRYFDKPDPKPEVHETPIIPTPTPNCPCKLP